MAARIEGSGAKPVEGGDPARSPQFPVQRGAGTLCSDLYKFV